MWTKLKCVCVLIDMQRKKMKEVRLLYFLHERWDRRDYGVGEVRAVNDGYVYSGSRLFD